MFVWLHTYVCPTANEMNDANKPFLFIGVIYSAFMRIFIQCHEKRELFDGNLIFFDYITQ